MKEKIAYMLTIVGKVFLKLSRSLYIPEQEKRCIPWFKADGDRTLRLNYDLTEKSIVFDLGGYQGQWSSDIYSSYLCRIYVFEPVRRFADEIEQRFVLNNDISVYQFGLSNASKQLHISIDSDSSSVFTVGRDTEEVELISAIEFFQEHQIQHIDLMKINIEGGEYDLLEHLIEFDLIKSIRNLQIQFHDFIPNASKRMHLIQNNLSKTHSLTYQFPFVWENWERKI